ncbi:hypothetical protein EMIT0196MI5_170049 [Pseudomonas sp. IT-196MI5]
MVLAPVYHIDLLKQLDGKSLSVAGQTLKLSTAEAFLPSFGVMPMSGWVQLQGEKWQVQSRSPLHLGQQVRVVARTGLMLKVIASDETPPRGG